MLNGQYICSILLVFSVYVSGEENKNEQTLVRGHYSFNRPPNFENYDPLLSLEETETKVQAGKTLRNSVIIRRSVKDAIPEDKSIEGDLLKNSDKDISKQNKRNNKTMQGPGNQQITSTSVNESNKPQENKTLERPSTKTTNKTASRRRSQAQSLKSKTNRTNSPLQQNLRATVSTEIENSKLKPLPTLSKEEMIVPITRLDGKSTKESPKRSRERKPIIPILENENFVYSHTGDFHYSYESGDGTKAYEIGELKTFDDKTAGEAVMGSFSYKDKDGNDFSLSYTADENGYRPEGAHLPTPPPIPPAIARALLYLSTKSTPQPFTESYL